MYFPYLYGRRSEFLALRAMLKDHRPIDRLLPIIEPVNRDIGDLANCIRAFDDASKRLAVVANPRRSKLKAAEDVRAWRKEFDVLVVNHDECVIPTFYCSSTSSYTHISNFIKRYKSYRLAIAFSNPQLNSAELSAICKNNAIEFYFILNGSMTQSDLRLLPPSKCVDIQDGFRKQQRNSDYSGAEFFTNRHRTRPARWKGTGDFACIGSAFSSGGTSPAAVVIHAIYKNGFDDIWIEHFISDETEKDVGSTAGKFLQAAKKFVAATNKRPKEFGNNFAIDTYADLIARSHFPGLGTNKVLQIEHHICLMLDVLYGLL